MKLTDTKIRSLKPREKLFRVADGHGLALEVTPNGSKLWRFRYRWAGRPQMLALGVYPLVTLLAAREKHGEMRRQLSEGIDPGASRHSRAARQQAHDDLLFGKVALDWLEERRNDSAAKKTIQKMETIINGDLIPELGKEGIATLKTPAVVDALKKVNARAPHMAQKARTYVNQIILYAIQKGLREDGTELSLRGVVKLPDSTPLPAATEEDTIGVVMLAIDDYPDPVIKAGLKLAAYSALRPGNVVELKWAWLDDKRSCFAVPKEVMKMRKDHYLPLPTQALAILEEARTWRPRKREYVFPPLAERDTPHLHRDTLSKALRDSGLRGVQVPHGFRATFRTGAREKLTSEIDLLETQLAHSKGDETARAYDRTVLLEKRRVIMQQWADHLDDLCEKAREKRTTINPGC